MRQKQKRKELLEKLRFMLPLIIGFRFKDDETNDNFLKALSEDMAEELVILFHELYGDEVNN